MLRIIRLCEDINSERPYFFTVDDVIFLGNSVCLPVQDEGPAAPSRFTCIVHDYRAHGVLNPAGKKIIRVIQITVNSSGIAYEHPPCAVVAEYLRVDKCPSFGEGRDMVPVIGKGCRLIYAHFVEKPGFRDHIIIAVIL